MASRSSRKFRVFGSCGEMRSKGTRTFQFGMPSRSHFRGTMGCRLTGNPSARSGAASRCLSGVQGRSDPLRWRNGILEFSNVPQRLAQTAMVETHQRAEVLRLRLGRHPLAELFAQGLHFCNSGSFLYATQICFCQITVRRHSPAALSWSRIMDSTFIAHRPPRFFSVPFGCCFISAIRSTVVSWPRICRFIVSSSLVMTFANRDAEQGAGDNRRWTFLLVFISRWLLDIAGRAWLISEC